MKDEKLPGNVGSTPTMRANTRQAAGVLEAVTRHPCRVRFPSLVPIRVRRIAVITLAS